MTCRYCARPRLAASSSDYCSKLCADRHRWHGGVPEDVRRMATRRAIHVQRRHADDEQASA